MHQAKQKQQTRLDIATDCLSHELTAYATYLENSPPSPEPEKPAIAYSPSENLLERAATTSIAMIYSSAAAFALILLGLSAYIAISKTAQPAYVQPATQNTAATRR